MSFINDDFILTNETAKRLYHDYAEKMPIIDYHCHINPKEIYENKKFKNILKFGLAAIITNGVLFAVTVPLKTRLRAMLTITPSFCVLPRCCHVQ